MHKKVAELAKKIDEVLPVEAFVLEEENEFAKFEHEFIKNVNILNDFRYACVFER
jgi:hypothetical protein